MWSPLNNCKPLHQSSIIEDALTMLLLLSALLFLPAATATTSCSSALDCSLNGVCTGGA